MKLRALFHEHQNLLLRPKIFLTAKTTLDKNFTLGKSLEAFPQPSDPKNGISSIGL